MSTIGVSKTIKLPFPHAGQRTVRSQARRFNWLSAGRRWRKTTLVMAIAVEAAIQGKKIIWGAPIYDQVRVGWDETKKAAGSVATFNVSRMTADFPSGGQILYRSLDNPDNVRGHTADGVVIDEAADVAPEAWSEALRPMLIDTGGWAWIIGTPKGLNWFHTGFVAALDKSDSMAWQVPTLGARIEQGRLSREPHPLENPQIPWDEIVELYATTPESSFKQEILAQFIQGEGAVFRNVDKCLTAKPTDIRAHDDHYLVAGVDWGKSHDFTAISVICCHCQSEVLLDRFNQIGWDFQRQRLLSILESYRVNHTVAELNAIGSPNFEALAQIMNPLQGLEGFEMTMKSKPPLIQSLALCFERERLAWLPDAVARHELVAYEAKVTESGYTKYSAPEGQWDDTVIARALAWSAAKHKVPYPLTEGEREELALSPGYRMEAAPPYGDPNRDGWEIMRDWKLGQIREGNRKQNPDLDDPWHPASPVSDTFWSNNGS